MKREYEHFVIVGEEEYYSIMGYKETYFELYHYHNKIDFPKMPFMPDLRHGIKDGKIYIAIRMWTEHVDQKAQIHHVWKEK